MSRSRYISHKEVSSINRWLRIMKRSRIRSHKIIRRMAKRTLHFKFDLIGCGRDRIVYDLGNGNVIKVAITKRGLKSNRKEYKLYKSSPSRLRQYLCRIKEYGRGWIVMKYMKPLKKMTDRYHRKRLIIRDAFVRGGIASRDLRHKNLAYYKRKRRLILIDYGNFEYI